MMSEKLKQKELYLFEDHIIQSNNNIDELNRRVDKLDCKIDARIDRLDSKVDDIRNLIDNKVDGIKNLIVEQNMDVHKELNKRPMLSSWFIIISILFSLICGSYGYTRISENKIESKITTVKESFAGQSIKSK